MLRLFFYKFILFFSVVGMVFRTTVVLAENLSPPVIEVSMVTLDAVLEEKQLMESNNQDTVSLVTSEAGRLNDESLGMFEGTPLLEAEPPTLESDLSLEDNQSIKVGDESLLPVEKNQEGVNQSENNHLSIGTDIDKEDGLEVKSKIPSSEGDDKTTSSGVDYDNHIPIVVQPDFSNDSAMGQGFFSSQSVQKPTIDISAINNSIDNYLANASQQELALFVKSVDEDKVKVLEYIIKNRINEEYVTTELAAI